MRAMFRPFAVVVVVMLAPIAAARADVAPPDGYVDPCASMTFEDSCRRCTVPDFKARDCHDGALAAGLVERCRGWSYAMYCGKDGAPVVQVKPVDPPAPAPEVRSPPAPAPVAAPAPAPVPAPAPAPAPAAGSGCAIGGHGDVAGFALVLLLAGVFRRRQ